MDAILPRVRRAPDDGVAVAHDRPLVNGRTLGPDLVRAIAALLVVYLHACVPYLTHPMPGLVWSASDRPSEICDTAFWAIEVFVMPLFLVVSGYYSYRAFVKNGGSEFSKSRSRRLLRPLAFAMVVVLPMDLYLWVLGLVADGSVPLAKLRSLKIPSPWGEHLWGLSHLWFLVYVYLYGMLMVVIAPMFSAGIPMRFRVNVRRSAMMAVCVAGVLTLTVSPEVVFGFQHSFFPVPSKWIYSGTFFIGGIIVAVFDPQFRTIDRLAYRHFGLGILATGAAISLGCWSLPTTDGLRNEASDTLIVRVSLACMTVLAAWSMTLGAIGMANRVSIRLQRHPRVCRVITYTAAASFWLYLVHHPIVGAMHVDLKWLAPGLSSALKSVLAFGVAVGWGLLSYRWMIQQTKFGEFLGLAEVASSPGRGGRDQLSPVGQSVPDRRAA